MLASAKGLLVQLQIQKHCSVNHRRSASKPGPLIVSSSTPGRQTDHVFACTRETSTKRNLLQSSAVLGSVLLLRFASYTSPVEAAPPVTSAAGQNVGLLKDSEIDKKLRKAGVKRSHDGHVAIQNKYTKTWVDVKCDFQVPGLLLLREEDGQVYWLGYGAVKQVDLSDDQVVTAVAADDWENSMTLVQAENEAGGIEALELSREAFYQIVSLIDEKDWNSPLITEPHKPAGAAAANSSKGGADQGSKR
eukprot:GHUV01012069.1.p1 GENE.GHUV01012069.1~~GHUV01012069.1.p1  ORF type:complete len:248 (+),score=50.94 GHUV01012069.1:135-878(+)